MREVHSGCARHATDGLNDRQPGERRFGTRRWALLIISAAFILRSPAFLSHFIDEDEAIYTVAAQVMNHGGALYRDAVDLKPPLLFFFYAASFRLLGDDMRLLHGLTVLWVLATALGLALLLRRTGSRQGTAALGALLYVLFTPSFVPKSLSTNGEILLNLPTVLAVLFYLRADSRPSPVPLLLAGLFSALAALFKYQGGVIFLALLTTELSRTVFAPAPRPRLLARGLWLTAGFLGLFGVALLILHRAGLWNDFYLWGWQYNFTYMQGLTLRYYLERLLGFTPRFILVWFVLWYFAGVRIKKLWRAPGQAAPVDMLLFWWLVFAGVAVGTGGKFFGHYFIHLLPPLCLYTALALEKWWPGSARRRHARRKRSLAVAGLLLPALVYFGTNWFLAIKKVRGEQAFFKAIAAEVRAGTPAGERIFIWGRMPEVYYFAKRLPASRFLTSTFVVGMTSYNYYAPAGDAAAAHAAAHRMLLADLRRAQPRYILDSAPLNFRQFGKYPIAAFPELRRLLQESYVFAGIVRGIVLYRRRR